MLIHMHEPQSSGVCIITHFDRDEVVMPRAKQLDLLQVMTFLPYQFAGDVQGFVQKSSKASRFPFKALNLGMVNNSCLNPVAVCKLFR